MGHHITGIIAKRETFNALNGKLAGQLRFALSDDLAFMPLDYENLDDITGMHEEKAISDFMYLTSRLCELLRLASASGELAYFETEYHGGNGGQGAVLFRRGEIVFGPTWVEEGVGPINQALSRMGVALKPGKADAFDVVGLDAYRSNEAFRERAKTV